MSNRIHLFGVIAGIIVAVFSVQILLWTGALLPGRSGGGIPAIAAGVSVFCGAVMGLILSGLTTIIYQSHGKFARAAFGAGTALGITLLYCWMFSFLPHNIPGLLVSVLTGCATALLESLAGRLWVPSRRILA